MMMCRLVWLFIGKGQPHPRDYVLTIPCSYAMQQWCHPLIGDITTACVEPTFGICLEQ
jgi:hypothetical protein